MQTVLEQVLLTKSLKLPTKLFNQCHCKTAEVLDSDHCFDLSGLIGAGGVTYIYSRQYMCPRRIFACGLVVRQLEEPAKTFFVKPIRP